MTLTPLKRPVISLKGVKKTFRNNFELGPVDLTVEPGSVVAVVGPNGSGKSTLFGILMNLIHADSGEVSLFGLSYPQDEVAIKQRIGYVPESSVGHDEMSARALGEFVSYWYPRWDQRLYQDLINRYKVDPDKKFGKLSKGMQRRLSFALALATGPELLLLDEPAEGVDSFARKEMLDEVERFAESGGYGGGYGGAHSDAQRGERTVVFATHVVDDIKQVADHVVLLVDGKFLGFHKKDSLLDTWKTFLVDREPEGHIPGVVEVDGRRPASIVTNSPHETAQALSAQSVRIVRKAPVGLEDILFHLMHRSKVQRTAQR
jgi:ABC-2 type transport system ATP-binding protein